MTKWPMQMYESENRPPPYNPIRKRPPPLKPYQKNVHCLGTPPLPVTNERSLTMLSKSNAPQHLMSTEVKLIPLKLLNV